MVRQPLTLDCAAGMGASLHGWRLPSVVLCARKLRSDTSVPAVPTDMLLARETWGILYM